MLRLLKDFAQIVIDEPGSDSELFIPKPPLTPGTVQTVFELAFGMLGAVCFLIIVIAGMKFTLSRGNPDAIGKARNTIIYAGVGLVISMLSFAIVRFVVRGV